MSLKFRKERIDNFMANMTNYMVSKPMIKLNNSNTEGVTYFINNTHNIHVYDEHPKFHFEYHKTIESTLREYLTSRKHLGNHRPLREVILHLKNKEIDLFVGAILAMYKVADPSFNFTVIDDISKARVLSQDNINEHSIVNFIKSNANVIEDRKFMNYPVKEIDFTFSEPINKNSNEEFNLFTRMHRNIRRNVVKETRNEMFSNFKY